MFLTEEFKSLYSLPSPLKGRLGIFGLSFYKASMLWQISNIHDCAVEEIKHNILFIDAKQYCTIETKNLSKVFVFERFGVIEKKQIKNNYFLLSPPSIMLR